MANTDSVTFASPDNEIRALREQIDRLQAELNEKEAQRRKETLRIALSSNPALSPLLQELDTINKAIENVLVGGQSYKIGSRSLTRADLGLLYKRQRELQAELSGDATSPLFGDTVVAIFDRR